MLSSKIGPLRPVPISPKAPKLVPIAPKVASQSNETLDSAGGSEGASAQTRFQLGVQNSEAKNALVAAQPLVGVGAAETATTSGATLNAAAAGTAPPDRVAVAAAALPKSPAKPQAPSAAQPLQTAAAVADQHQQQLSLNHLAANEVFMKQQQHQAQQAVAMYAYWNMYANMCANATKQVALMGSPMSAANAMSAMQCMSPGMAPAGYPQTLPRALPGVMKPNPAANMNMANMAAFAMGLPPTSAAMAAGVAGVGSVSPMVLGAGGIKVPDGAMELQGSRTNSVNSTSTTVMATSTNGAVLPAGRHQKRKYEKIRKTGAAGAMEALVGGAKVSSAPGGRKTSKKCAEASQNKVCSNCGTSTTPFWRKNKNGGLPLCNACGLYFSKNDAMRPKELWKEEAARGA